MRERGRDRKLFHITLRKKYVHEQSGSKKEEVKGELRKLNNKDLCNL